MSTCCMVVPGFINFYRKYLLQLLVSLFFANAQYYLFEHSYWHLKQVFRRIMFDLYIILFNVKYFVKSSFDKRKCFRLQYWKSKKSKASIGKILPQKMRHILKCNKAYTSLIVIKMRNTYFQNREQHGWWLMFLSSIQFEAMWRNWRQFRI